ncbi:sensor histidine kinase [Ramlibacter sp. PS4R-6]|uniref:sensor histidine kinase n=1 Tax=Ramlibacter sp. PS4R-6 TaxID=3133438 RepID=UPI00309F0F24
MNGGKPSLRRRIAQHVLVPLVVTWALGAAVALGIAEHFVGRAFDRALLDDAYALASHVRAAGNNTSLVLTREEMNTLLFDQSEAMYFAVRRADGTVAAGNAQLPAAQLAAPGEHEFANIEIDGRRVRAVSLRTHQPEPFTVVIGQTTRSRTQLLAQLLAFSALPQAVLLALLAWWLRRRIQDDMAPLATLHDAIERRGPADLAPLPPEAKGASTRDVERIAQAIDALLQRVQQSLQEQREFAGNVAHELRTPLAGIRAQATFALAQGDAAVWREQLEGIAQAEQRASRLVDQLLALARAGEGREGLALAPIALQALVREVLLRFMPRARAAGVDLGGEGLDDEAIVNGDRALIEGLLGNLIDNALRYGSGAAQPHITVAVGTRAGGIELSVADNGAGLPSTDAEQLKKRWAQGDGARRVGEGAGLGLSIVERYAELLGARFTLANGEGGGVRAAVLFTR